MACILLVIATHRGMSGGQRSFVTLALLLALGSLNESPFRVMDEFDVYMDSVARKTAMDTLIAFGRGMLEKQFIYLTPNAINAYTSTDVLRIHNMPGEYFIACTPDASAHVVLAPLLTARHERTTFDVVTLLRVDCVRINHGRVHVYASASYLMSSASVLCV